MELSIWDLLPYMLNNRADAQTARRQVGIDRGYGYDQTEQAGVDAADADLAGLTSREDLLTQAQAAIPENYALRSMAMANQIASRGLAGSGYQARQVELSRQNQARDMAKARQDAMEKYDANYGNAIANQDDARLKANNSMMSRRAREEDRLAKQNVRYDEEANTFESRYERAVPRKNYYSGG